MSNAIYKLEYNYYRVDFEIFLECKLSDEKGKLIAEGNDVGFMINTVIRERGGGFMILDSRSGDLFMVAV